MHIPQMIFEILVDRGQGLFDLNILLLLSESYAYTIY